MRRAIVMALLLSVAGLLAGAAAAMAVAWRRDALHMGTALGRECCAEVTLVRDGTAWNVEHVGWLGSNPNFDAADPDRRQFFFFVGVDTRGQEDGPWYGRWEVSLGPVDPMVRTASGTWAQTRRRVPPSTAKPDPLRDLARGGLSNAIRAGAWPWPHVLAQQDTGTTWKPVLQIRRGLERARWIFAIPSVAIFAGLIVVVRARKNFGPGRCHGCGYDLRGLAAESACPECAAARPRAPKEITCSSP
jgi:hypothetical protein